METTQSKLPFYRSGYYFIGLIFLVLAGFWRTYFSKLLNGTADFTAYFHFNATMVGI
ncbi:MAG: hypothetical protein LCH81_21105 [Bacteroidetes bacterium]|nr:hypothetical protein [Bacteroidota bacterium]